MPIFQFNEHPGIEPNLAGFLKLVCHEMAFPYSAMNLPTFLSGGDPPPCLADTTTGQRLPALADNNDRPSLLCH